MSSNLRPKHVINKKFEYGIFTTVKTEFLLYVNCFVELDFG